jgi:hypothetical protein
MAEINLLLIWLLVAWPNASTFQTRWVSLPPSINIETYRAARKAAARPSFCQWDYPGTPCRLS